MQNNTNDNDLVPPLHNITAEHNIKTLDLLGASIMGNMKANQPIPVELLPLVMEAIAQVRIYCTFRDQKELTDANSLAVIASARVLHKRGIGSVPSDGVEPTDAAAEEILADLRKSGVIG
jgi:hypothetical protein